jgi:predicted RNA-binding protein
MCEATVYLRDANGERKIMQDVVLVQPEGEVCRLSSLLGEQKLVQGHVVKIDLLKHIVYLNQPQEPLAQ